MRSGRAYGISFYVIKHGDTVVWKEYSFYEDAPRFPEIVEIFKKNTGVGTRKWLLLGRVTPFDRRQDRLLELCAGLPDP